MCAELSAVYVVTVPAVHNIRSVKFYMDIKSFGQPTLPANCGVVSLHFQSLIFSLFLRAFLFHPRSRKKSNHVKRQRIEKERTEMFLGTSIPCNGRS